MARHSANWTKEKIPGARSSRTTWSSSGHDESSSSCSSIVPRESRRQRHLLIHGKYARIKARSLRLTSPYSRQCRIQIAQVLRRQPRRRYALVLATAMRGPQNAVRRQHLEQHPRGRLIGRQTRARQEGVQSRGIDKIADEQPPIRRIEQRHRSWRVTRSRQNLERPTTQIDGGARRQPFAYPKRGRDKAIVEAHVLVPAGLEQRPGHIRPSFRQIDHRRVFEGSDSPQMIKV